MLAVAPPLTRIFSDLHYGERVSIVQNLAQLDPLLAGIAGLVLNGDSLDTRPGPHPATIQEVRRTLADYLRATPTVMLTGNHDPDISTTHLHELAGARVLVTHGDIMFDDIVPWGRDAPLARQLVTRERGAASALTLEQLLHAHRRAAGALPRRLPQTDTRPWQSIGRLLVELLFPPTRVTRVLRAWSEMPARTAALARTHRPEARFLVVGHTHRPGIWKQRDGRVVINTGSFCRPLGRLVVDVAPDHLIVRRVVRRGMDYHPGERVAEFALASAGFLTETRP